LRRAGGGRFARRRSGLVPGLAPVIGALNDLPEPPACLRRVNPIGISGRSLQVIHFPACKMRTADIPFFALPVRRQDKRTFLGAYEYPYRAHSFTPPYVSEKLYT